MGEVIFTGGVPASPLYSQAVRAGGFVFVSGLTGMDATGALAGPTIQEQTRQALANVEAVLEAAGGKLGDIVEIGALIVDPEDFAGFNEEYATWFPADPPARYVGRLGPTPPGVLISIRATAFLGG